MDFDATLEFMRGNLHQVLAILSKSTAALLDGAGAAVGGDGPSDVEALAQGPVWVLGRLFEILPGPCSGDTAPSDTDGSSVPGTPGVPDQISAIFGILLAHNRSIGVRCLGVDCLVRWLACGAGELDRNPEVRGLFLTIFAAKVPNPSAMALDGGSVAVIDALFDAMGTVALLEEERATSGPEAAGSTPYPRPGAFLRMHALW